MNFKSLVTGLISLALLSGCTNNCSSKPTDTPAENAASSEAPAAPEANNTAEAPAAATTTDPAANKTAEAPATNKTAEAPAAATAAAPAAETAPANK